MFATRDLDGSLKSAAVVGLGLAATSNNANGSGNGVTGDQTHEQYDTGLIQAITQQDFTRQENGLHINFLSRTGHRPPNYSSAWGDYSEKSALYVTARMDPGAGPTWAFNPDLVIMPDVGNQGGFTEELDITNFNRPYRPNGVAGNTFQSYRGFVGFPITAGEFWTSAAPSSALAVNTTAGSATISVTAGTVSVDDVLNDVPGIPHGSIVLSINGSTSTVNYSGGGVVLSNAATATGKGVRGTGQTYNMYSGISFLGAQLIRDTTIADGSDSVTTLKVYGTHTNGVDTQNSTLTYFGVMAPGQQLCFANSTYCLAANTKRDAVVSSVRIEAPSFTEALTTPSSSSAPCAAGQFTDDAYFHYVCVSKNKWKRVALSSF